MRYLVFGFCVFATACAGTSPTAPTSSRSSAAATLRQSGGTPVTQAQHGSELPFSGNIQATETVDGTVHHLAGTGNGTQVGLFTSAAEITIDEQTGEGVGTVVWTAANGDQVLASTHGEIVLFDFPIITLRETQLIAGGTAR